MKDSNDEMDAKRQVGVAAPTKPAVRRRKSSVMRKSLALGTIAAAGLTVAACDDAPSDQVFKSISDCKTSGFSAFVCEKEFTEARARHAKTAPKFKPATSANRNSATANAWCTQSRRPTGPHKARRTSTRHCSRASSYRRRCTASARRMPTTVTAPIIRVTIRRPSIAIAAAGR